MSTLRNAAAVLRSFSSDTPEVNVTAVADRLRIPKSTSSRLLKMMSEEGLLESAGSKGRYRPGPLAVATGQVFRHGSPVASRLDGLVADIVKTYGGQGAIVVRDGREVFPLMRHGSDDGRAATAMGLRTPAHATAAGRALLARQSDAELKALYRKGMGPGASAIGSVEQLVAELAGVRHSGVVRQEVGGRVVFGLAILEPFHDETWGIEVAIKGEGQPTAALDRIQFALIDGVSMIGARVGDRYWLDWKPSRLGTA